jgi:GR25 family glycosyltransferase involved in LPS biosynthesis
MLVDLIRSGKTDPLSVVKYLKNEDQIFGIVSDHYFKYKNYKYTSSIIKFLILEEKIRSLKKYRNIIWDIFKNLPDDNNILYLHCLVDCGLNKNCLSFLDSITNHEYREFLYCFYHLQTKNYSKLVNSIEENIENENIVSSFFPSVISELSNKNCLDYIKLIHKAYAGKNKFTKETQDLIENTRWSYLHNKKTSLVVACMDRQENLLKALPSWINIPYIKEIIVVDYSSKIPLINDFTIKSLVDEKLIKVLRVDGEQKFNLGKAYNLGFDNCKYDTIIKIDCDYLCLDYSWLDILYKSNQHKNTLLRGCYEFSNELSGFFLIPKSKLVYFREDLNGYGYDEIDLYNRTKIAYPKIKEIVWFDIENSIKHIDHYDNQRVINYVCNNTKISESKNRELCQTYSPISPSRNSYSKNDNILYKHTPIDRIFCINLKERSDRWESLKDIPKIEQFNAIKSNQLTEHSLRLNPVDLSSYLYFKLHPGAIGCFLSHYCLWNKVVNEGIEYSLIIEDDVDKDSIIKLFQSNIIIENFDLINLSKRFRFHENRYLFDGGESYILSLNGAKKLLYAIENTYILNKIVPEKFDSVNRAVLNNKIIDKISWHNNSICCALDKFIGYCCENDVDDPYRLKYYLYPVVDINILTSRLSNINNKETNAWDLSYKEVLECLNII